MENTDDDEGVVSMGVLWSVRQRTRMKKTASDETNRGCSCRATTRKERKMSI